MIPVSFSDFVSLKSISLSCILNGLFPPTWFYNIIYSSIGKWWLTELCICVFNCWHIPLYNIKYTIQNIQYQMYRIKNSHLRKSLQKSIRKVFKFWEAVKLTVVQVFQTSPFYLKAHILSFITNMSVVFLKVIGSLDCFWDGICIIPTSEEPQLGRCSHQ